MALVKGCGANIPSTSEHFAATLVFTEERFDRAEEEV
jgi:hypothetical protein